MTMNLPSVAETGSAKLPASYVEAKKAIAYCAKIDECKDWSDKAMALASYARQAQDETLLRLAKRIIVRAIDREGEILKSIPEGKPGPKPKDELKGDAPHQLPTRKEVAKEAGLSEDQAKQAIRVNNVPRESFEEQVESDNPPSVTELASQGTRTRSSKGTGEFDRLSPAVQEGFIQAYFNPQRLRPERDPTPQELAAYQERKEQEAAAANIFSIQIACWCKMIVETARQLWDLGVDPTSSQEEFRIMLESEDFLKTIDGHGNGFLGVGGLNWEFVDADTFRAGTERLIGMIEAIRAKKGVPIPPLTSAPALLPAPAPEQAPAAPGSASSEALTMPDRKRAAVMRAHALGLHDYAEEIEQLKYAGAIRAAEKELDRREEQNPGFGKAAS